MHIHDAGHQCEAASIELAACPAGWPAYFGNAPVLYRHVRRDRHVAAAVIDGGPANQQIKHASTLSQVTRSVPPGNVSRTVTAEKPPRSPLSLPIIDSERSFLLHA